MKQSLLSFDQRYVLRPNTDAMPFRTELSLTPLIAFWQHATPGGHALEGALAEKIGQALQDAPALCQPTVDISTIRDHQELVDMLMTAVFPAALWKETYAAALLPFRLQSFYATPTFERLMLDDTGFLSGRVNLDDQTVSRVKVLHAYAFVLRKVYGIELDFDYPIILTVVDPDTGLDRHFRTNFDGRFIEIRTDGEVPPLTPEDRKHLLVNLNDPQVLMELIPPERFVLHGFAVINAVEVTDQEVLSSLKRDLIEKETIISSDRFQNLQQKLRTLFRKPDLCFGLAAHQRGRIFLLNTGSQMEHG